MKNTNKSKIGFIGLGHMGTPMVKRLLAAGYPVQIYDIVAVAVQTLATEGAVPASSIAELTKNTDIIITMVQTSDQVRDCCIGTDGIFAHLTKTGLYIDCSSIDVTRARELHQIAEDKGLAMLDAPVSGGVAGATAGTLTIMVGGSENNFQRALAILNILGRKVVHAGPPGNGQVAKICNNLLLAISMIGVSEAFTLAEKLGLNAKTFFDISSNASGQCWSMTHYCPVPNVIDNVPANRHYQPGFMAKMMLKDLRLGQHAAEMVNASIPLGALAAELYELYVMQGQGETDFSGIINFIAHKKNKEE
jgi:3-hydroxyisobutyrate dehydrogenase